MTPAALRDRQHWVFDMDGTLTLAIHDFPAIKRALDIPQEHDILAHLAQLPEDEAAAKHAWLLAHERELAWRRSRRRAPASWCRPCTGAVASWAS